MMVIRCIRRPIISVTAVRHMLSGYCGTGYIAIAVAVHLCMVPRASTLSLTATTWGYINVSWAVND